ncbi:MAG: hypothetical protein B6U68_00735 [Candidatus Aenigmarchaeota archaeon ex4484_14]|nr:MAG: hypothetical protein B6U68_00735 [Candidatus Aenigmarchaeota archaeon ex4484_14]
MGEIKYTLKGIGLSTILSIFSYDLTYSLLSGDNSYHLLKHATEKIFGSYETVVDKSASQAAEISFFITYIFSLMIYFTLVGPKQDEHHPKRDENKELAKRVEKIPELVSNPFGELGKELKELKKLQEFEEKLLRSSLSNIPEYKNILDKLFNKVEKEIERKKKNVKEHLKMVYRHYSD